MIETDGKRVRGIYAVSLTPETLLYTTAGSWQTCKNRILYFYFSIAMVVWSRRALKESSHTLGAVGSLNGLWKLNFSQNSRPYIVLKLPCDQHILVPSSLRFLLFVGHCFHHTCLGYHTYAFLFFWLSLCWFYQHPNIFVDFICQVHCWSRKYTTLWFDESFVSGTAVVFFSCYWTC